MLIRSAIIQDIPSILDIEREAETHWTEEQYCQALVPGEPFREILVAEEDSHVVGFAVLRIVDPEAEIENLVINEGARRKGIGMLLLTALIEVGRKHGVLTIHLEVREANLAARNLYKKAGLRQNGRRRSYYKEPEEDAILFCLVSE